MKHATTNERLDRLEDFRAGQEEHINRLDDECAALRLLGTNPSKLRTLRETSAGMHDAFSKLLLTISRAHHDEGSFAGAREHAESYAQHEHIANTLNENLMRERCDERVAAERERRERIGEQAFQVEHYLALWKSAPTKSNWRRVIDAAKAYYPEEAREIATSSADLANYVRTTRRKVYFVFERSGGPAGSDRQAIGRWTRVGTRGKLYNQVYRKGSNSWTGQR